MTGKKHSLQFVTLSMLVKSKKPLNKECLLKTYLTDLVVEYRLVPLKISTFKKNYIWLKQKSIFTKFILRDSSKNKPLPSTLKKDFLVIEVAV